MLQISTKSDTDPDHGDSDDESLMHLSICATSGTSNKKSMRLQGLMHGKQVLILIDSGSNGSFISHADADKIQLTVQVVPTVWVTVANGRKVQCDSVVLDAN